MRVYCRPGATPFERLEAYLAFCLCHRPDTLEQVAELLVWAMGSGPTREESIRRLLSQRVDDPAEALGMARAVLLLCGLTPEQGVDLSGRPRIDFDRLMEGGYRHPDPASPTVYAAPSLLDAYNHMGAGFARGVDRMFRAVTGQPLSEHLRRALALLNPAGPELSFGR